MFGTGYGTISSAGLTGHLYYSTGISACYGTGSYYSMTYTGAGTGDYTTFTDTIRVIKDSLTTISHNLILSRAGLDNFHVDYDASYSLVSSSGNSFVYDDSYYTGFKMNGIVSEETARIALATDTGVAPTGYNLNGLFDNAVGLFTIPNWNQSILYYNGVSGEAYSTTGIYINLRILRK